ncbi:MAG: hypothetical protein HOV80_19570 [Polyangiaceae bacterium]|nr:hypothetical protein [Polyangiaceae bacterium]
MPKTKGSKPRARRIKKAGAKASPASGVKALLNDSSALARLYNSDAVFRQRIDVAVRSASAHTQPWAKLLGVPEHTDEATLLAALTRRLTGGAARAGAAVKSVAARATRRGRPAKKAGATGARRGRPPKTQVDGGKLAGQIEQRLRAAGGQGLRAEALSLPFRSIKPAYKRELEKLIGAGRVKKKGDRRTTTYTWAG